MARYLNTPEAHALGEAVLDLTMPGAVDAAQAAQEDGLESTTKGELAPIVDGADPEHRHALDVRDSQDFPEVIGRELATALENLGWKLERAA